ncbi:MAG: hemerythrin domain-containing protein [Streptosporangiales bacterium]|nr:hemerythrin domain-containing protein [Streptosporangiales bacterium]
MERERGQERLAAFGTELIAIHDHLRQELATVRQSLQDGHHDGPGQVHSLAAHCLAFCSALDQHHSGEDSSAFPALRQEFSDLAPVITKLEEDRALVASILQRLNQLLGELPTDPDAQDTVRVTGELDGPAAIIESHFTFEERTIVTALDALDRPDLTARSLFGISPDCR